MKRSKKSSKIYIGSMVDTTGSSSWLETSSSMAIIPGGRLSVIISFTLGECGGSRICAVAGV